MYLHRTFQRTCAPGICVGRMKGFQGLGLGCRVQRSGCTVMFRIGARVRVGVMSAIRKLDKGSGVRVRIRVSVKVRVRG